jgi:uncharacterized membrane protein YsdA (DUF1294 family)
LLVLAGAQPRAPKKKETGRKIMEIGNDTLAIGILAWNLITFLVMGVDKRKAVKGRRRISESSLLALAFVLGAPGILTGMMVFRHKTKKVLFLILVPLALITNVLTVVGLISMI